MCVCLCVGHTCGTMVAEGKTLVAEGKTLVAEGKTLVAEGKTLVTEGKTLVTKGKTLAFVLSSQFHQDQECENIVCSSSLYKASSDPLLLS